MKNVEVSLHFLMIKNDISYDKNDIGKKEKYFYNKSEEEMSRNEK